MCKFVLYHIRSLRKIMRFPDTSQSTVMPDSDMGTDSDSDPNSLFHHRKGI